MTDGPPLSVALPTSTFLPQLGGAEVGLHNIATRLQARGHQPMVIAPWSSVKQLFQEGWRLPYRVTALPPRVGLLMRHTPALAFWLMDRYFSRLQRNHDFDFWHCTIGYPTGVWMTHFAESRGDGPPIPHLVRCAGDDIQRSPEIGYGMRLDPQVDRVVRRWLPRADRLVAITESVAEEYRALGVEPERISRIPNGVDLERFAGPVDRAAVRARLGIDPDSFLFLAVGRNHRKKNFQSILRAIAALRDADQPTLLVVGDRTEGLQPLVEELGIQQLVRLREGIFFDRDEAGPANLPARPLVEIYKCADAFVFPSFMETFGIVLVEAMAAGLPIITADSPGCRDVIRRGRDGLMVPPDDLAALQNAMSRVMHDAGLRQKLAEQSRTRAADFSWDTVVERYVALYRDGVERARQRFREHQTKQRAA